VCLEKWALSLSRVTLYLGPTITCVHIINSAWILGACVAKSEVINTGAHFTWREKELFYLRDCDKFSVREKGSNLHNVSIFVKSYIIRWRHPGKD
jgi:hypothetical protein